MWMTIRSPVTPASVFTTRKRKIALKERNIKQLPLLLLLLLFATASATAFASNGFPLTIENCGRSQTFEKPVRNAIINNINMAEMVYALGFKPYVKALTGVTGAVEIPEDFHDKMGDLPELTPRAPGLELLARENPDLFFFGWSYGIAAGGAINPDRLEQHGINSYILEESCIRVTDNMPDTTMDVLYRDFINLGKIFGEPEKGEALVEDFKTRIAAIETQIAGQPKPRVLLFDGTPDDLVTSGSKGMGHAIIEAAGGVNVAAELPSSWVYASIESVVRWNPEYLIFRHDKNMEQAIQSVIDHPVLGRLEAVRERRFTYLSYAEMVPGARVVDSIERVAKTIHPSVQFESTEAGG